MPLRRLSVRSLMVMVALIAISLALHRFLAYNNEPDRRLLLRGERVVVRGGPESVASLWQLADDFAVPPGTSCTVVDDDCGDRDNWHTDRPTTVRIVDGPDRGSIRYVTRARLRPDGWLTRVWLDLYDIVTFLPLALLAALTLFVGLCAYALVWFERRC